VTEREQSKCERCVYALTRNARTKKAHVIQQTTVHKSIKNIHTGAHTHTRTRSHVQTHAHAHTNTHTTKACTRTHAHTHTHSHTHTHYRDLSASDVSITESILSLRSLSPLSLPALSPRALSPRFLSAHARARALASLAHSLSHLMASDVSIIASVCGLQLLMLTISDENLPWYGDTDIVCPIQNMYE